MAHYDLLTLRQLYIEKKVSPSEIVEDYLTRIEKHQDFNIYITVNAEQARRQAAIATQRYQHQDPVGPLEGIPVAYKDNLLTQGLRTTSGSAVEKNYVPDHTAPAVQVMQQAGAVNLGKLNMHEYAFGITSNNPFYGPVKNPWNPEYTPGGSSGGCGAALAADLAVTTLGTDTGGSIRIPAAACGVVGFKTSRHHISAKGTRPISLSLDHVGPLAKTVSDMAFLLGIYDQSDYLTGLKRDIKGVRIGVPMTYFQQYVEPEVKAHYEKALKQLQDLGAILVEVPVPVNQDHIGTLFTLAICEAAAEHAQRLQEAESLFGEDVLQALRSAAQFTPMDYIYARQEQQRLTEQFNALFLDVDLLVTPTVGFGMQKIGVDTLTLGGDTHDLFSATTHHCAPFNLTGHPAISIPYGRVGENLPIGLQLVGAQLNERLLLQVAYAYESAYLNDFYMQRKQLALL